MPKFAPNLADQITTLQKRVQRLLRLWGNLGLDDGMQHGRATTPAVSGLQTVTVVFPWPFTAPPDVQVTAISGSAAVTECLANNITNTQFDVVVNRSAATGTLVQWLAYN